MSFYNIKNWINDKIYKKSKFKNMDGFLAIKIPIQKLAENGWDLKGEVYCNITKDYIIFMKKEVMENDKERI